MTVDSPNYAQPLFLDASENDEDTTTHSGLNYINRIIRPLAYPRYGCYTEKNAKMHTYSR